VLCHQATIIQHSYYSLSLHSYKALKYIIVTERKNALTIDETYLIETIVYKKSPLTLCNS